MTNLLKETKAILANHGKDLRDILWAGTRSSVVPLDLFLKLAEETDYDAGFGGQEVATDLIIVGDGFWLERHEYDGSEWWEFKSLPMKPDKEFRPSKLVCDSWGTLEEGN